MNHEISKFCSEIKKRKRVVIASHANPEGDSVGSAIALCSLLKRIGIPSTIVCEDPFPKRLGILDGYEWITVKEFEKHQAYDAIITVDCPALHRVGSVMSLIKPDTAIFNIDHHTTNTFFGHFNYVQPEASSCGEVVYDLFTHFKTAMTKEEAEALYVAISTDTGSFKYGNTTQKAHFVASKLIEASIDVEGINERLYATYSAAKLQLYSYLLSKVKFLKDQSLAWAQVTKEDLKNTGGTYEDTEGFIDFLKYLKETRFAVFFIQLKTTEPGLVRVSFRSKGADDISKVAAFFGGGGHKKSAGCTIPGSMDEVTKKVIAQIRHEFRN